MALAHLLEGQERGDDGLHAAIQALRIREDWVWVKAPLGWKLGDEVPPEATQYPPPKGGLR